MLSLFARVLRNAGFLAILGCLGWFSGARAESIVYTSTVPIASISTYPKTFTFPKFDPTVGILTHVALTVTGELTGAVGYENRDVNPAIVNAQFVATLKIIPPNNVLLNAGGPVLSINDTPLAFDGVIDFAGTSGKTYPFDQIVATNGNYTLPAALAPYIGVGNLTLPISATGVLNTNSSVANLLTSVQTRAGARGNLLYLYAIPQIEFKKFTNHFDADNPNGSDVPQITPGAPVTWTYVLTNTGAITIPFASIVITDSQPGVTPVLVPSSDVNGDNLLSPNEVWVYQAVGVALNLDLPPAPGITVVSGCNPTGTQAPGNRPTYFNIGQVTVPGAMLSDPSHYCNLPQPGLIIKKLTNNFDANDADGADVPQIAPGAPVTWTYIVTNTGNITFAFASVVVTDSQPGITPVWVAASDVNSDNLLSPGETWRYQAKGIAQNLKAPSAGVITVPGCNPNDTIVPGQRPTYFNIGQVSAPGASANDPSHYCNPPVANIALQKTVYKGHNQGGFCPGGELVVDGQGKPITYCFEITNTGETYLSNIVLTDTTLGIKLSNLTLISGTMPLAPNAKLVYFYQTTLGNNLVNVAAVQGHPTDNTGQTIPGLADPTAQDSAEVQILPTAIDLLYINMARDSQSVALSWATLPTRDTAGYYVYRGATDQRSAAVQINQQALIGHNESRGEFGPIVLYALTDANPPTGPAYYWLVEVKVDGSTAEVGPLQSNPPSAPNGHQLFLPQISR